MPSARRDTPHCPTSAPPGEDQLGFGTQYREQTSGLGAIPSDGAVAKLATVLEGTQRKPSECRGGREARCKYHKKGHTQESFAEMRAHVFQKSFRRCIPVLLSLRWAQVICPDV